MEYTDFFDVERDIDNSDRSKYITESLCDAIIHILSPRESALLFCLYDGKKFNEIALEWEVTEDAVFKIRKGLVEKLEPFLMGRGILSPVDTE